MSSPSSELSASCCTPIDQPGVGSVHASHCNLAGSPYVAGLVPEPLRTYVDSAQAWLLSELVFAARQLAEHSLDTRRFPPFCHECGIQAATAAEICHQPLCRTGRVLAVLAQLQRTVPVSVPDATGYSRPGGAR